MGIAAQLSPESLTAIEILESIGEVHRDQALELLRDFAHELRSEKKWGALYKEHPEPMITMDRQALKEHRDGNSREL